MATVKLSEPVRSRSLTDIIVNDSTDAAKKRHKRGAVSKNVVVDVDARQDYEPTKGSINSLQSMRWAL